MTLYQLHAPVSSHCKVQSYISVVLGVSTLPTVCGQQDLHLVDIGPAVWPIDAGNSRIRYSVVEWPAVWHIRPSGTGQVRQKLAGDLQIDLRLSKTVYVELLDRRQPLDTGPETSMSIWRHSRTISVSSLRPPLSRDLLPCPREFMHIHGI